MTHSLIFYSVEVIKSVSLPCILVYDARGEIPRVDIPRVDIHHEIQERVELIHETQEMADLMGEGEELSESIEG